MRADVGRVENEKSCYAGRGGLKVSQVKLNPPRPCPIAIPK